MNLFQRKHMSSRWQMFFNIGVLKNIPIFTGKHLCWSLFLIKLQAWRIYSCEYFKIFKNSFIYRTLLLVAFESSQLFYTNHALSLVFTANLGWLNLATSNSSLQVLGQSSGTNCTHSLLSLLSFIKKMQWTPVDSSSCRTPQLT